jgi:phosphoribosyl 1,2-cyclic phosphodiesterase
MGLRFTILASGSTGNAVLVEHKEVKLLVDAGLSMKKIEELLMQRNRRANEISAILVTHEHSDHIKGVGAMARKYDIPIYANEQTWHAMEAQIGEIRWERRKVMGTGDHIDFDLLRIESFPLSHDAAEPMGYCFQHGEYKLSLATDLGYVSPRVKEKIADSDVLILESNHDTEMLRIGRYPWNIKRRILSDMGHLSNEAAGEALCEIISNKLKRVYLAHLSQDHNMLDLARLTVNNILEEGGISLRERRIRLMDTFYDRPTMWDNLAD